MCSQPLLEIRQLTLSYAGNTVLGGVNVQVASAEIHALVGENGAGKSSLFKCMMGMVSPDSGEIVFLGQSLQGKDILARLQAGLSMMHQELMLIPELSVLENLFLGRENQDPYRSLKQCRRLAEQAMQEYGLFLSLDAPLYSLSLAQQQLVEVLRALLFDAQLILMDEPTASLTEQEVQVFYGLMMQLKSKGIGVVFTSHKMDEVFAFSDRISVLRDGKVVDSKPKADWNTPDLLRAMVGREMQDFYPKYQAMAAEVVLEVQGLCAQGLGPISFELRAGEILGLSGLIGAGRTELAECLYGLRPIKQGQVRFLGQNYQAKNPNHALKIGIAYLTEDRKSAGILPEMSLKENLCLGLEKGWQLAPQEEQQGFESYAKKLNIKYQSQEQAMQSLSGGNQQKVLFARLLAHAPKLLILDEPSRGIDVASKYEIYQLIYECKAQGRAILLISSDLPEVMALSDRVMVLNRGKQAALLDRDQVQAEVLLNHALHV